MPVTFKLLADCPEVAPSIARWWFDQWGHKSSDRTPESVLAEVRTMTHRDRAPLAVVALDNGRAVGVATWKPQELRDLYPDCQNWLGGVYVAREARGAGLASQLCRRVLEIARQNNAPQLYLQTEHLDGGLYTRLGWQPIEQTHSHGVDVLVMVHSLSKLP